jgi:7-carboxy-7-deazaguanine synthase (Cx14CxxC type)
MTYAVKEIFYTLQGEGANTGRAAVFCRFAGCNLWSGREQDRATAACNFCDTDFVGTDGTNGGKFGTADILADAVERAWQPATRDGRFVVLTGGEPLLQVDQALVAALHARGFNIAVETNGTIEPPPGIDWLCVSPKGSTRIVATRGQELKLVYPQAENRPEQFRDLQFDHFFLQPKDGPDRQANTELVIQYCMTDPRWRMAVQTHKMIGVR